MPQPTEFWLLSLKGSVNFLNLWSCIWDFHQHRMERNRENEMYKPQISLGFLLARSVQPIPRICSHWAIKSMRGQQRVKDFAAGRTLKIAKPPLSISLQQAFRPVQSSLQRSDTYLHSFGMNTSLHILLLPTNCNCSVMRSHAIDFCTKSFDQELKSWRWHTPKKRHVMVSHTLPPYREGLQTDLCGKDQYISCPVGHTKYLKWPLTLL